MILLGGENSYQNSSTRGCLRKDLLLRKIAHSPATESEFHVHVQNLKASTHWKESTLLQKWFDWKWLKNAKRYILKQAVEISPPRSSRPRTDENDINDVEAEREAENNIPRPKSSLQKCRGYEKKIQEE
uniref:Uncharacterized protein n=1 Tax=Magallana gigas TaxID=29159 RepID=K1Q7L7_MAGGI